jgi:uncharacterized protein
MNYRMMFHSAIIKPVVMKKLNKYFGIILLLLIISSVSAQEIPAQPQPPRLVNDLAGVMKPEQIQQLEATLVKFNDSTSTQISLVTVKSLNGTTASDMAVSIGNTWGVGQKKYNNGIVILIKPKTPGEKGDAAIATGYGLEGKLPDAIARRIIDNVMIPKFSDGDYAAGIDLGAQSVMKVVTGEYTDKSFGPKNPGRNGKSPAVPFIILIIMAIVIMSGFRGRGNHHSIGHGMPLWPFLFMGGFGGGGGSNSGGGFGGGGGGGFGGFGGGGFGGGGASGSW